MPAIDLSILNQRQTPAFYADVFANRPAAGFVGRIFVSTNTFAFYRDNGTGWDLIGGPGTGTITGSGTVGTVPLWNGASTIGDSTLIEGSTKFTTTKDIQADAFYLNEMTAGNGALYFSTGANRVTLANYNASGTLAIEVNGGATAQFLAADLSTTFYGNIIRNGGTSSQFLKADGSLDSNTYNTGSGVVGQVSYFNGTNSITGSNDLFWDSINGHLGIGTNVPGTALDVHHDQPTVAILNQTVATNDVRIGFQNNGVGLWRIGAFYNAGANDFGIYDAVAAIQPVTVKKTTGQVLIGTSTVGSGKLVVASTTGDNGVQIVGTSAPSLRIDNAESGPTKRAGFGISTATNNFIQGSADRDFCMFNGSTTASPILFGIYDAGAGNVQEAARISAARNLLIGGVSDAGQKLQVAGTAILQDNLTINARIDNFGELVYKENSVLKWNLYNDYTNDQFKIGNSGGAIFSVTQAGVATFSNSLYVNGAAGADARFIVQGDSSNYAAFISQPSIYAGSYRLMRFYTGGNITMNIDSPNGTDLNFANQQNGYIDFRTNAIQSLRITNAGNTLINTTTDNGAKLQVNGSINGTEYLGNIVLGINYGETSTTGTTSIVDTGINYNTANIGYNNGTLYKIAIIGNPNAGGADAYRSIMYGYIIVNTGYDGSNVKTYITYQQTVNANAPNVGPLTVSVVFWNGTTESSNIDPYTANVQIRVKVTGYNSSYIGAYQQVRITKVLQ
jgi:hypothetical protein